MDGEEGSVFADILFENLNKYILVIDLLSDVIENTLKQLLDA